MGQYMRENQVMGLWEMIVAVVLISAIGDAVQQRYKSKERHAEMQSEHTGLSNRLKRIEDRLGNLETLVVESEKHNEFDKAL